MNRTVTDRLLCSTDTSHTSERSGSGWTVTWLPGRVLTPSQAEAAMNIAEELGTIPACPQWKWHEAQVRCHETLRARQDSNPRLVA